MDQTTREGRQALIVMDCQCAIIENFVADSAAFMERAARAIDAARVSGVLVIYVVVAFRPGHPEIAPQNRMFAPIGESGAFLRDAADFAITPQIAPQAGDVVIEKHRVSSFEGTDLEMLLRAQNIGNLALCGVMTSGCVLSTVRRAADLDFALTVIADLCADIDTEVQQLLLERIFPSQADVVSADSWISALRG